MDKKQEVPKMKFESWFAFRERAIPNHHHKEILKADFKAQGVKDPATIAEFDQALKKYGVVLS